MKPTIAPAAALLAALLAAPAAPGADAPPWNRPPEEEARLLPDPEGVAPPFTITGDAVELTANGLSLRVEGLNEQERRDFFELRTDVPRDPLPPRAAFPQGFTVFELSLRNHSGRPVRFQPALTACRWTRDNELLPVHFDQIFEMMKAVHLGSDDADRLALQGTRWFHVEPLELQHGQSATRLLVFEGYGKRAKTLSLELGPLLVGSETFSPVVDFLLIHPPKKKR